MSDAVDMPADRRPGRAEPRDGASINSATPSGEATEGGAAAAASEGNADGPRRNRRRGSRGGRGRKKPGGQETAKTSGGASATAAVTSDDGDRRPDLPDRPGENRPSPDAAARALIPKPKIGDSRPAPVTDEVAEAPAESSTGTRRR